MKKSIKTKIKVYKIKNFFISDKEPMEVAADCPETAVFYWLQTILANGRVNLKNLRRHIDTGEYFEVEALEEKLNSDDNIKDYFTIDVVQTYDFPWSDQVWYEVEVEGLKRKPSRRICVIEDRDG